MASAQGAVKLIEFDKTTHTFVLTQEGEAILLSIDTPLAVLGIVGKQKTGKSYLANRILQDSKLGSVSSGISHTIKPGTRGIWVHKEPIFLESQPDTPILLLDSEGLGCPDNDANYDARIFMITLLLSSTIVYNSIGPVDERALESIEFVGQLAQEIKLEDAKGKPCTNLFPSFVWLLRDFALKLENPQGKKISAGEYLEVCLEATKGTTDTIEKRNKTRRVIKYLFEDRDCYTLVRPAITEFEVQRLDKLKPSELRPEFLEQSKKIKTKLLKGAEIKRIANTDSNGPLLLQFLKNILEIVNSNRTLVLPTIHDSVIGSYNETVVTKFRDELSKINEENAWEEYWKKTIGSAEQKEEVRKQLEKMTKAELASRASNNAVEKSKHEDTRVFHRMASMPLHQKRAEDGTYEQAYNEGLYDRGTFGQSTPIETIEDEGTPRWCRQGNHKSMIINRHGDRLEMPYGNPDQDGRSPRSPRGISGPPSQKGGSIRGSMTANDVAEFGMERVSIRYTMEEALKKEKLRVELEMLKKRFEEKAEEEANKSRMAERLDIASKEQNSRILSLEIENSKLKIVGDEFEKESKRLSNENLEMSKKIQNLKDELNLFKNRDDRDSMREPTLTLSEHYAKLDEARSTLQSRLIELEKNCLLKDQELVFLKRDLENQEKSITELRSDKKSLYDDILRLKNQFEKESNLRSDVETALSTSQVKASDVESKLKSMEKVIDELKSQNKTLLVDKAELLNWIEELKKSNEEALINFQERFSTKSDTQDHNLKSFGNLTEKYMMIKEELDVLRGMLNKAASLVCSKCHMAVSLGSFPGHRCPIQVNGNSSTSALDSSILTLHKQPQTSARMRGLNIEVMEVMVKENRENRRLYVEYKLKARRGKKEWEVIRKYKEFCELWTEISKKYSVDKFSAPVKDLFKLNRGTEAAQSSSMADRHKILQDFLNELCTLSNIPDSEAIKIFLQEPVDEDLSKTYHNNPDETLTEKHSTSYVLRDLDKPPAALALLNSPKDRKKSFPSGGTSIREGKSFVPSGLTRNRTMANGLRSDTKSQAATSLSRRVNLAKYLPKK